MTLRIEQDAAYKGQDRWEWSVWIEGPSEELARVESVTYHLHPTFPDPVRVVANRRSKFRLSTAGWGMFTLRAEIVLKDGRVLKRSHDLVLEYPETPAEQKAGEAGERNPSVFIASSVADRPVVSALRGALEERGVTLIDDSEIQSGLPWEASIERALRSTDAIIAVVSDITSPSVESEIRMARAMNVPVLPVHVGRGRKLPEAVRDSQALRLRDPSEALSVADQVVKSLHGMPKNR